ncbi:hormogonium polysaccharide biosynthesis glycosyltransferase HpsE [Leptolyngbya sp. Heron Island J]|uniref:hormogonium polysaccharide biosynthesis glycosyltransferase HpsE n=1 Tax=Leptolyngbya sp. Heron Island J TaxID=1385935 RepID=UPI00137762E8|nr:hormogonium polysaccharide biosynthesis glycosyltransferase HpsE [Leptolyngbya sp. Heron Island J]
MMTVDFQPNKVAGSSMVPQRACLDISVVIPTYNGAERIPQVLAVLKQQENLDRFTWEVIVCDNNSCDRTADIVADYQRLWSQEVPLRYCFVAEQGAAFARQRGVTEARGHMIAFLDDDNIPALDWLSNVYRFAQANPSAGAFGSQIHGDFQGVLPQGFEQIACFLAIVERGSQPHLYQPKSKILPPAAGLAVRRSAWLDAVPERLFLNHKGKSAGLASEDLEALLHIQKAGWEIWYNSDMVITHQIPESRLQREYLVSLLRCVGLSRSYIRFLGAKNWQRLFKMPAYVVNDLRKLGLHCIKHGLQQHDLNLVAACERALLLSTVASPVFLLKKASQDWWQNWRDNIELPERQLWLRRLTDTFEKRQLELYQQSVIMLDPVASSTVNEITGLPHFEILLRLRQESSEHQPVSPKVFFPTAERYGLIRTLDRRVVQQLCELLGPRPLEAVYSLNLSAVSVADPSFPNFLEEQLQRNRVIPQSLCFELPVSAVINAWPQSKSLMERMKHLGLRVAIDDVSDGEIFNHSGAPLLIDCLKLSQTAVAPGSRQDDDVLTDLIQLSRQHHVQLVAKGVETQAAIDRLQTLGIAYFQGYQFSKPVPFIQDVAA